MKLKLSELLAKVNLPFKAGERIMDFKIRNVRDATNHRVVHEAKEDDAFYITHAANCLPELFEALRELDEATRSAARLRATSCGDKLHNAEQREVNAYLGAGAALRRAENVETNP